VGVGATEVRWHDRAIVKDVGGAAGREGWCNCNRTNFQKGLIKEYEGPFLKKVRKLSKKVQRERGRAFPGVKGKVVHYVDTAVEEDNLYIHVRFADSTELCFRLSSRIVIDEANLSDWKTGDDVIKRTYIQSPEARTIMAQGREFQRICRQIERENKRRG